MCIRDRHRPHAAGRLSAGCNTTYQHRIFDVGGESYLRTIDIAHIGSAAANICLLYTSYLPKLPDDSYAKTETLKILKQHKAYMAQFEELLNDEKIA